MCIIIDANVVVRVFFGQNDKDFHEIFDGLFGGGKPRVRIVYGGELRREYLRVRSITGRLAQLDLKQA